MAGQFIAFGGSPDAVERRVRLLDTQEKLRGSGFAPALSCPNLVVLVRGTPSFRLAGRGLVVGRLRSQGSGEAEPEALSAREADPVLARGLGSLLDRHWGEYVAFLAEPAGPAFEVLRDPSGAMPVHFVELDGLWVFFSDLETALLSGLPRPAPDPTFALEWLAFPYLRTARTGIQGVRELLAGEAATCRPGGASVTLAWRPWRFAARGAAYVDRESASAALREVLVQAIPKTVAPWRRPLVELSGGLDSSILAVCLANAGIGFSSVNFVTRSADGDERRYAEAVAARAGGALEHVVEPDEPLDLGPGKISLRPGLNVVLQPLDRSLGAYAAALDADAIVSGAGGDNIFCYLTTAAPAVDAARMIGPAALLRTLADVAALNGCSFWTAARYAARKAMRAKRPIWKRSAAFLLPELPQHPASAHPWLDAPADALAGKREHVEGLVRIQHFLDLGERSPGAARVHPLIAQPILETCLRIPSWMWVEGGRNRAVARDAMHGLLPDLVARRRTKGRLESLCARAFSRNRLQLRALLMDGELARLGIADRAAIGAYFDVEGEPGDELYLRLFELATIDLWLAAWRR